MREDIDERHIQSWKIVLANYESQVQTLEGKEKGWIEYRISRIQELINTYAKNQD